MHQIVTTDILVLLQKCSVFNGLDTETLNAVYQAGKLRQVSTNTYLFYEEQPADAFYILLSGRVRLSRTNAEGHQVILNMMGPGAPLAIVTALETAVYPATAQAIEETTAIVWDSHTITQLMDTYPRIAFNSLKMISYRFRELQDRYRELATERVERRVARTVLRLTKQAGKKTQHGIRISMPLTREDIAQMTGTTLYTVSRIFSRWEQQGLIKTGRGQLTIVAPHEMVMIAEDLPAS